MIGTPVLSHLIRNFMALGRVSLLKTFRRVDGRVVVVVVLSEAI